MIHVQETDRNEIGERVFVLTGENELGRALVAGGRIRSIALTPHENEYFHRDFLTRSVIFALLKSEDVIETAFYDPDLEKLGFCKCRIGMRADASAIDFRAGGCSCCG